MQKAPAGCRIDRYTTLRGTSKRKNKITPPIRRRFSLLHWRTGTLLFYALMLRSKGEKGLAIYGFPGGKIRRQGIYTFPPENGVLLHSKPISAPIRKPGHGGYLIATSSYSFSWITFIKCNNRGIIKHFFHFFQFLCI